MKYFFTFFFLLTTSLIYSQVNHKKNPQFNACLINALQGDITKTLSCIESLHDSTLSDEQIKFKIQYIDRFKNFSNEFNYNTSDAEILALISIYREYWNDVLLKLSSAEDAETKLSSAVTEYLYEKFFSRKNISKDTIKNDFTNYVSQYLESRGCFSATGKTAGIYDLLLWKKENPREYKVTLPESEVVVKVVFMQDVITMGWEDYATLGKYFPGGWATSTELNCVESEYDTTSENFTISYLKHEGQHFADYKAFPKLSGCDLEYRAKLVELAFANESLQNLISFFIKNSKYDRENPHAFASYCLIRDMSKKLFNSVGITDIEEWKKISTEKINKTANELLIENTKLLKAAGADTIENYIK